MQLNRVFRMMLPITEWCVGPAPFRQAQGPERVEGLAAGPRFIREDGPPTSGDPTSDDMVTAKASTDRF